VKFAFASFDNSFARRLGQNAANAVAYGLPYEEALKSRHIYPARISALNDQGRNSRARENSPISLSPNGDPLELTLTSSTSSFVGSLLPWTTGIFASTKKYSKRPRRSKLNRRFASVGDIFLSPTRWIELRP